MSWRQTGMHHRLPARGARQIALTLTLAACQPAPLPAPATSGPSPSGTVPAASEAAVATPLPSLPLATSAPVAPPSPPDLPAELADVAWAAYDGEAHVLSVGLLGQPASMTRAFSDWTAPVRPENT